jgi:beta-glucanase (GH16 family)
MNAGTRKLVVNFDGSVGALDAVDVAAQPSAVSPSATPPPTMTLHGHTYQYNAAMSDEFSVTALDSKKWLPTYNGEIVRLNDEWECFTENGTRPLTGHSLNLVGKKTGSSHSAGANCASPNYESGMIRSSGSQKYGYFAAAMKLPAGAGMWPAFWLIPAPTSANGNAPAWPPEIDILEMVNNGREGPHQITQFLHGCGSTLDTSLLNASGDYPAGTGGPSFADGAFHEFAVEWTPSTLYLYVDSKIARTYAFDWDMTPPKEQTGLVDPAGCSKHDNGPASLIIDLAMGGQWPGDIDDEALPQTLEIDYVRTYSDAGVRGLDGVACDNGVQCPAGTECGAEGSCEPADGGAAMGAAGANGVGTATGAGGGSAGSGASSGGTSGPGEHGDGGVGEGIAGDAPVGAGDRASGGLSATGADRASSTPVSAPDLPSCGCRSAPSSSRSGDWLGLGVLIFASARRRRTFGGRRAASI